MDFANIAMDAVGKETQEELKRVRPELFVQPEETELWNAIQSVRPIYESLVAEEKFTEALASLQVLVKPINNFMDNVRVLAKTLELQRNRWNLLREIEKMTMKIGDLTQLRK